MNLEPFDIRESTSGREKSKNDSNIGLNDVSYTSKKSSVYRNPHFMTYMSGMYYP